MLRRLRHRCLLSDRQIFQITRKSYLCLNKRARGRYRVEPRLYADLIMISSDLLIGEHQNFMIGGEKRTCSVEAALFNQRETVERDSVDAALTVAIVHISVVIDFHSFFSGTTDDYRDIFNHKAFSERNRHKHGFITISS